MATDKIVLGYMQHVYEPLFGEQNENITSVLEIGVAGGESIREWALRFPKAIIHGIDTGLADVNDVDQARVIVFSNMDAYTSAAISRMLSIRPQGYDVIIDDGPHTLDSQLFFIRNYGQLLAKDGVMILEDIITPGGVDKLKAAVNLNEFEIVTYDMRGKQLSLPLRERWKGGLDVIVLKKVQKKTVTTGMVVNNANDSKVGVIKNA